MPRFVAMSPKSDDSIILDTGLEMRIETHPRLGGEQHAWGPDAARSHLLGEQGIDRMQGAQAEQSRLLLHQRPEGERAWVALPGGVLVLREQPDIGPILALRGELQKSFESRRIVTETVTGIGRKLRFHPELQPIVEPVFQLVDGSFATPERKIVLELQLMVFNDRAADL